MEFEELEEDGRRYTWVPFMSDAFITNAEGDVAGSSDVVEVEFEDARTSEAMRVPPDTSSVGLYKRFNTMDAKSAPDCTATYHNVDAPRNTIHTTSPLSQGEQLLRCGALCDTWHHVRLTLFSCNEH